MKVKFLAAMLLLSLTLFAQDFELGKVSEKELLQSVHPLDPEAPAAILSKKGNSYFDIEAGSWILITEVEVRTKIYNKEGYKYATVSVPYYAPKGRGERVIFSDAATYNIVNGKIEKTNLKEEGKFTEEVTNKIRRSKIALPNVKEGSVVEYKYVIKSPYIHTFPEWFFQYKIPADRVEYNVNIPQLFAYNRILNSYFDIQESDKEGKRTAGAGVNRILFHEIQKKYFVENVPAFKSEDHIDNPENYMAFVKHELAAARDMDGVEKQYATDWKSVIKSIYEDDSFGNELDKASYFKEDLHALLAGITDEKEKLEVIFNYIKNRMAWNGYYGYECRDNIRKAYDMKSGNIGEINLMLIAMLKEAGLQANPVLLSTKDNGEVSYVSRNSFNYVIAGVSLENEIILLDASNKYAKPGILPVRALNGKGRLIKEDFTSQEVELLPLNNSKESVVIMATLSENGNLDGAIKARYHDYHAMREAGQYNDKGEENYIKHLENELNKIEIGSFEFKNEELVEEEFEFTGGNVCDIIGDKIYIPPMLFYTSTENPFKEDNRRYPIDFIYPAQERYTFFITIPEGFTVESLPSPVRLATLENIGTFSFNIAHEENRIQIMVNHAVNYAKVGPEYYSSLKDFYTSIINKQSEKIVLKKV